MAITITTLSLFYHTHKLEKIQHHLIVVECWWMNKFVGGIVNLAQIHENIVQMFGKKSTLLPLMAFLQSQGKCIVDCLHWT